MGFLLIGIETFIYQSLSGKQHIIYGNLRAVIQLVEINTAGKITGVKYYLITAGGLELTNQAAYHAAGYIIHLKAYIG